jgi:succinyl-CoA synthetase beta subunit
MASSETVDIEEVAARTPEKIVQAAVDPCLRLKEYQTRSLQANPSKEQMRSFNQVCQGLYAAFMGSDADLAEINPLAIVGDGQLIALDGKMVLDDSGLFRHPELAAMRDEDEETPEERMAREAGLSYVKLDGEIGCMVNGAGLAMATMDIIKYYGGSPANFLDVGGARHKVSLPEDHTFGPNVKVCQHFRRHPRDEVARGILQALEQVPTDVPWSPPGRHE